MSYASKFMSAKSAETTATPSPTFMPNNSAPTTSSSLFGARRPTVRPSATITEAEAASNPWAARAAAANGIKIEEKLNFESEKQFPALSGVPTLGAPAPAPKKGAWGNSTVTAASLAADWAAKEAEEKAAAEAERLRRVEEAERIAAQRQQYTTFTPSRSDVFRREVYENEYEDGYDEDGYDERPDDGYDERRYELAEGEEEQWRSASSKW
jgi:hypothetical protein